MARQRSRTARSNSRRTPTTRVRHAAGRRPGVAIDRRPGWEQVSVALFALAPVVVIPGAENRFVFGKVACTAAGLAAATAVAGRGRLARLPVWLLAAGSALLVVAILASPEPLQGLVGRAPRYEGLPMMGLYLGAGWAGAHLLGPAPPPPTVRTLTWALTLTAVAVALIAVLETAGLRPLASDVARPGSLLGNASDEGALGVLLTGALGWPALSRRDPVTTVGAGAAAVVVALSASRAALAGLVVVVLLLAIASRARSRVLLGAALAAVVVLVLLAPESRARVTGTSPLATATTQGRTLLWEESLGLLAHHPILGTGPDNYLDSITVEHNLRWQLDVGPANPPDSPHDWVLQAADDGGIGLAGLALAIAGLTARAGWRRLRAAGRPDTPAPFAVGLFAGLAGYGVALLFGFTTPGTTPLAAFFGGALLAVPVATSHTTRAERSLRLSTGVLSIAIVVAAALAVLAEISIRDGIDALAAGNLQSAQRAFHRAHQLRPWDAGVAQTASYAYVQVAEQGGAGSAQAAELARPWLSLTQKSLPHNEEQVVSEASESELAGDFSTAARLFEQALMRDPDNPQLLLRLGVVQGEQGDLARAQATLLKVTTIARQSPEPWTDLAIVYGKEGNAVAQARATATATRLNGGG